MQKVRKKKKKKKERRVKRRRTRRRRKKKKRKKNLNPSSKQIVIFPQERMVKVVHLRFHLLHLAMALWSCILKQHQLISLMIVQ